jgi:hypothetical protein
MQRLVILFLVHGHPFLSHRLGELLGSRDDLLLVQLGTHVDTQVSLAPIDILAGVAVAEDFQLSFFPHLNHLENSQILWGWLALELSLACIWD